MKKYLLESLKVSAAVALIALIAFVGAFDSSARAPENACYHVNQQACTLFTTPQAGSNYICSFDEDWGVLPVGLDALALASGMEPELNTSSGLPRMKWVLWALHGAFSMRQKQ